METFNKNQFLNNKYNHIKQLKNNPIKQVYLAERKEDLVAYKQLITIKRSLERDKQRIQYGMKVSGQRVIPVSDTIAGKSY